MNIKIKDIISISEARSKIFELAELAYKKGCVFAFTENGKPKVVMMSVDNYENLMEDLKISKDKNMARKIKRAEQGMLGGDYRAWEDVKKDIFKIHSPVLKLADSSKIKYKRKK